MSIKHYINRSGQLFFLNEINRRVFADSAKIHKFSDEDVENTPLLKALIGKGAIIEVPEDQVPENVLTGVNLDKVLQPSAFDTSPDAPIAEPLGHPQQTVSINPEGMSRLRDYVEPPPKPNIAVDPANMSRYADTMSSLRHGPPDNNVQAYTPHSNAIQAPVAPQIPMGMAQNAVNQPPQPPQPFTRTADLTPNIAPPATVVSSTLPTPSLEPMPTPKATSVDIPEIWWCGPANDAGGYGRMNRECVEGLHRKGVKVELDLFKIPDFRCAVPITDSMKEMMDTKVADDAPSVWAVMPQRFMPRAGKKVIYTMIETSEVQNTFLEKCKMANEIWLPSKSNIDSFNRADIGNLELVYMPLGVDTDFYKPMELTEEQKSIFNIKTKGFTFLCLCGWSLRKGTDVLMKAYLQQFTGLDDVTLVIAARKDGSTNRDNIDEIRNDIKKSIRDYCPHADNPPHIIHIGDVMAEGALPILYNIADCFVLPSRGEGFGLPYCEAGACEVPVIATRCGGQLDFLTDENSFLVDIDGFKIGKQEIRCLSSYYEDAPFAVLGTSAIDQLKEHMQFVIDNPEESKEKAGLLRKNLEDNFTWKHLVERIHERVKTF